MAEEKKSFPMLPVGHWWQLRKQFKKSIPGVVTDSYLATVLSMQSNSARANVLPFLKDLGIINTDSKPTDRAKLWRDDARYPEVCKAILAEVYPRELLDAVPDPGNNRTQAESWFAHQTGAGQAAVRRMAALYQVLAEGDPSKQPEEGRSVSRKQRDDRVKATSRTERKPAPPARPDGSKSQGRQAPPEININLQVHISADATPDQIEQIFASMAKHIYQRG